MSDKEPSSPSNAVPNTSRIEVFIIMLTLLIKIGKYLPWIILAFAGLSLALAVLSFTSWNSIAGGIINLGFAAAGFIFLAQIIRRRKIHRQSYYQHTRKIDNIE